MTFPIIEIFGPTIQGEGALQGKQTMFVRFGGCDYHCSWCDSMHAVDPALVRANVIPLTSSEIVSRLLASAAPLRLPPWITLSGGNPALHDLSSLIHDLHAAFPSTHIAVETQGTKWQEWLTTCEMVIISPKPPSSGMSTNYYNLDTTVHNLESSAADVHLKVVAFDKCDLDYVEDLVYRYGKKIVQYISVGTLPEDTRDSLCERWKEITEMVLQRPTLRRCAVLCQSHVLLWGHEHGV